MRFSNEKEARDFLSKCKSASQAISRFAGSGFNIVTSDVLSLRENECRKCPEWDKNAINKTGRCNKCGCSTWIKLRMATERCPLGKWEAVSVEDRKQ